MASERKGAKDKILTAAVEIAQETGPANLSLDAVALKAGVSKGGLLYHFRSKAKLLEAMVEFHLQQFDSALNAREQPNRGAVNSVLEAYLDLFPYENSKKKPAPSTILAALAENPDLMAPVRRYERALLDRMKENCSDPAMAMVAFLAVHGAQNMAMLRLDVIDDQELDVAMARIRECIKDCG